MKTKCFLTRNKDYPSFRMPQCMGLKTDGARCAKDRNVTNHPTAAHLQYCAIHHDVYNRRGIAHVAGTCHKWVGSTHWCGRQTAVVDGMFCQLHVNVEQRREQRNQLAEEIRVQANQILAVYIHRQPVMNWRQVVDDVCLNHQELPTRSRWTIAHAYFFARNEPNFNQHWQFHRYWAWVERGRVGGQPDLTAFAEFIFAPPPAVNGLALIATDVQNVHTEIVVQQTNKGLETLLEASKTSTATHTPEQFAVTWLTSHYGWNDVVRVVNDMKHWYGAATCKIFNDRLYKRALDGLYLTIKNTKDGEIQAELFKRAFEECSESVGMCCEGHISRMSNVMVGFDDAFAPPVPFGEILQNKMAAIYAMDIDSDEKRELATEFLNEFAVPEIERSAWLDAF